MKKRTIVAIAAVGLLAAGAAEAETTVYSGAIYDVIIEPHLFGVDVGLPNPGGEDLVGVMLKIRNKSGDPLLNPSGFDGVTGARLGFYTMEPDDRGLHHQHFGMTPTLDEEMPGNVTATLIDTHFNFMAADVLFVGTAPSETNNLAPSAEPPDATGPFGGFATVAFGNRLYGNFAVVGGAAADVDGDGDPATWELAWFAVPGCVPTSESTTIFMNFFVTGFNPGEVIVGQFLIAPPEPATMSLLALGGISLLRKRR